MRWKCGYYYADTGGHSWIVFILKIYKNKTVDWYKGVKVTTTEGVITAVTSEWRTDEGSLRVRQRGMMYISEDTTVVKGTISGVVTAVTK